VDGVSKSFIDSLTQERIGGRYVVERVLRAGGMGVVAAGRYPELDQEVAIKFMLPELAAHEVLSARFLREARLAAKVKSPHFVRVFDFGRIQSGVPYIVMEMLAGRDLRDEIAARGALPVEESVDYLLQAAVGIAEIHSYGVVHRDLKPSNLFLAEAAGARSIKVLDFGVSKEKSTDGEAGLTTTGHMIGTAQYMSPEQIKESKLADTRSDVWALGVILYEMLTTSLPFGADSEAMGEIIGLILHTDPIPLSVHRADLPRGIEAVVFKCLQREPENRYATVADLADALRPFASVASAHRIEAIHRALGTAHPAATGEDEPSAARVVAVAPTMNAPTKDASPGAKRASDRPPAAKSPGASPPAIARTPEIRTPAQADGVPAKGRGLQLVGLGALGVLVLVAGFAVSARGFSHAPAPDDHASAAGADVPAQAAATQAPTTTISLAAPSVAAAGAALSPAATPTVAKDPAPAPSAVQVAAPAVTTAAVAAVQPRPAHSSRPRPAVSATSAPPVGISLDQLDRK
jgi:serine/threonine-protein kinase